MNRTETRPISAPRRKPRRSTGGRPSWTALRPPRQQIRVPHPGTWNDPLHESKHDLDKYGHLRARCFARLHVQLNRQTVWAHHPEPELPLVPGTVIRLDVERTEMPDNDWPSDHAAVITTFVLGTADEE